MHFIKLAEIDTSSALSEVKESSLWDYYPLRTTFKNSPHKYVSDIVLRFPDLDQYKTALEVFEAKECVDLPAHKELKEVRKLVFDLFRYVEGEQLGRCVVTKLPAGRKITGHVDDGSASTFYNRFHIVLQGHSGSTFFIEEQQQDMLTGEVWMIANDKFHWVENNSKEDRIHIVVDIKLP